MGTPIIIACFSCFAALLVLYVGAEQYSKSVNKNKRKKNKDTWIFSNFNHKFYKAVFGETDPDEIASKLKFLNVEQYYKNCKLTEDIPNVENLIVSFIYGIFVMFICFIIGALGAYIFFGIGLLFSMMLCYYPAHKISHKAENMRNQMSAELPRFLDLLSAELDVGIPVEIAIQTLSEKMTDSLLAKEMLQSFSNVKMGASAWNDALTEIAEKYDIEELNDFVLNINTAYKKGTSITGVVARKAKESKSGHLLKVKEKAGKMTNTILIPIAVFQIAPLILFLMVPSISQISGLFGG